MQYLTKYSRPRSIEAALAIQEILVGPGIAVCFIRALWILDREINNHVHAKITFVGLPNLMKILQDSLNHGRADRRTDGQLKCAKNNSNLCSEGLSASWGPALPLMPLTRTPGPRWWGHSPRPPAYSPNACNCPIGAGGLDKTLESVALLNTYLWFAFCGSDFVLGSVHSLHYSRV